MKRRVVILTEIIAPYRIAVFNALAERPEIDLHVLFLSETDPSLRQWSIYEDEIRFSYRVLPHWRKRIGRYNVLLNRGVTTTLNQISPDAIVCGGYSYVSSWRAAAWARDHGVPLFLWSESTAKDIRNDRRTVEFLKSKFLNRCSAFVVPGKSAFAYLCDLGVMQRSIFTAPNAVDTELFSRMAQAVNGAQVRQRWALPDRFFLYVGRLVIEKGIFELLEAYARLDRELRSKVGLVFVGDGSAKSELLRRIAVIRTGSIHCMGFMQREYLADLYATAEALVLPTYTDTWGLVINEAMSCSLPIITSTVAGAAEDLVQDGWNGLLIPPKDIKALSSALCLLAQRPELREQMRLRSAQRIAAYSPGNWASGLVQALETVCTSAT